MRPSGHPRHLTSRLTNTSPSLPTFQEALPAIATCKAWMAVPVRWGRAWIHSFFSIQSKTTLSLPLSQICRHMRNTATPQQRQGIPHRRPARRCSVAAVADISGEGAAAPVGSSTTRRTPHFRAIWADSASRRRHQLSKSGCGKTMRGLNFESLHNFTKHLNSNHPGYASSDSSNN